MKRHCKIVFSHKPLVGLVTLFAMALGLGLSLLNNEAKGQTHTSALYFFIDTESATIPTIHGLSADGSTVVGSFKNADGFGEAFVWSVEGGLLPLGTLGGNRSLAIAVSADGSVVAGYALTAEQVSGRGRNRTVIPSRREAFRWTAETGMTSLGSLGGESPLTGDHGDGAWGVSADGSVIAGHSRNSDGLLEPFRWTMESKMVGLGTLGGNTGVVEHANRRTKPLSADGSTITGYFNDGTQTSAFVWTLENGMKVIPEVRSLGYLSWDGSVAAGYSRPWGSSEREAYVWTDFTEPFSLGMIGDAVESDSRGITADGGTVVGRSYTNWPNTDPHEAFVWDWADGMRALPRPVDLNAYAGGVSLDGSVIGGGVGPSDSNLNWEAVVWYRGTDSEAGKAVYDLHFLRDVLKDGGVDIDDTLEGWWIEKVSGDGNVVVGKARVGTATNVPFIAILKVNDSGDDEPGDDPPGDDGDDDDGIDQMTVDGITYADTGPAGRHLQVTVAVVSSQGAVAGASVSATLENEIRDQSWNFSGTTANNGTVTFQRSNAPSGFYRLIIHSIDHPDFEWDEENNDEGHWRY